jgi:hypothetical protein
MQQHVIHKVRRTFRHSPPSQAPGNRSARRIPHDQACIGIKAFECPR